MPENWQQKYAVKDWTHNLTMLTPEQEMQFQAWAMKNKAPVTPDYDMRGFWQSGAQGAAVNPSDQRLHFPDTYKTPLHESFSGESIFADPSKNPPMWHGNSLIDSSGQVLYSE